MTRIPRHGWLFALSVFVVSCFCSCGYVSLDSANPVLGKYRLPWDGEYFPFCTWQAKECGYVKNWEEDITKVQVYLFGEVDIEVDLGKTGPQQNTLERGEVDIAGGESKLKVIKIRHMTPATVVWVDDRLFYDFGNIRLRLSNEEITRKKFFGCSLPRLTKPLHVDMFDTDSARFSEGIYHFEENIGLWVKRPARWLFNQYYQAPYGPFMVIKGTMSKDIISKTEAGGSRLNQ